MNKACLAVAMVAAPVALACPAYAAPGDPVKVSDTLAIDPIIEGRMRYERVEQPTVDADAVTLRLRAGLEVKHASGLSFLAESEGTLAVVDKYNAFPFPIPDAQRRPAYAVVSDPMSVELNRLQLQYKSKVVTLTVGRQRIMLDDQRFVGNAPWRQNEQTFDAARAELKLGPVQLDGTYAIAQHTIFGNEAGPRQIFEGNFVFLGAGAKLGPVQLKAFTYLLDYKPWEQLGTLAQQNADTATYGGRAVTALPLGRRTKLNLTLSYARQTDYKQNPVKIGADYVLAEAIIAHGPFALTTGYEKRGSSGAGATQRAVQTPLATLHKFNGWADMFLVTPAAGLEDLYASVAVKFPQVKAIPGLNAVVTFHRFDSDAGSLHYGDEWDASIGAKLGRVNLLAKFADYDPATFGPRTRKFWLQAEFAY